MINSTRLLVYDPEQKIGRDLLAKLNGLEFTIRVCEGYDLLPRMVRDYLPQTLIVHLKPNDEAGLFLVHEMTKLQSLCPFSILVVLERESELTEVRAYEAGADSVVVAPIRGRSIKHRLWALNRWSNLSAKAARMVSFGRLLIDIEQHLVSIDGETLYLAKREFELLYLLAQVPGKIYSRLELLERVAGADTQYAQRTVDVHICNLRYKLPAQAILTYRGKGYYLNKQVFEQELAA